MHNNTVELSRLPLPHIRDDMVHMVQYTHKQNCRREDSNRFRPPKYKPRPDSNFNRSFHAPNGANNSNIAHVISFRTEHTANCSSIIANSLPLSTTSFSFQSSPNETFFEQSFTCVSKIGEGSFGEVFKVRSKEDGRLYAVKKSKEMFRSEHYRAERLEEVRRYEEFSEHENCIRFYRAWEQDDRLYMQMELCRESLETYLWRRKQIPEERIWGILLDLLLALKSLHDRNLLHLDIKLDNVLMDDDETCKLADFGLVIDVDKANRNQATEGDSRYIAPEIMQGKFSKAADIFSLGIAMLELSCYLELPANGPLWQQLRKGMLPNEFLKNVSVELQNIIKDMMTPDPEARPTVDKLLAHKRLVELLQRRQQWDPIRRLRKTIRATGRLFWSKLCNIKYMAFQFVTCMLASFSLNKPITDKPPSAVAASDADTPNANAKCSNVPKIHFDLVGSTPLATKTSHAYAFLLDDDIALNDTQHGTPANFTANGVINSTPLHSEFEKSILRNNQTSSTSTSKASPAVAESPFSNYIIRRPLETSSLRRKLFDPGNE